MRSEEHRMRAVQAIVVLASFAIASTAAGDPKPATPPAPPPSVRHATLRVLEQPGTSDVPVLLERVEITKRLQWDLHDGELAYAGVTENVLHASVRAEGAEA